MKRRIPDIFKALVFILLCFISTAVNMPETELEHPKTWSETVLEYQKILSEHLKSTDFTPYQSPVLKIRDYAYKINVDVSDMDYIKLVVGGTIDGNTKDHAAWGKARFIDKNGHVVYADEVPVWKEIQGWSNLTFDRNLMGSEILIGNNPYDKGFAMHAEGYAIFKLDKEYERFEAEVGVEQKGGDRKSSVLFRVEDYMSEMLMDQLEKEFPQETKLLKNYTSQSAVLIFGPESTSIAKYVANRINLDKGIRNLVITATSDKERLSGLSDMLRLWIGLENMERINPESTLEVYSHLTKEYGIEYLDGLEPADINIIHSLEELYSVIKNRLIKGDTEALHKVYKIFDLVKRVNLSNPLVKEKSIVLIRHQIKENARKVMANGLGYPENNWTTSASISFPGMGWKNDIVVLENVLDPKIRSIYKPAKPVLINDPDLHWDGKRILFSSIGENGRWHLFEVNVDGSGLKQLTPDGFDDLDFFDACYLPNGKIAMVSTAPYQGVPCVGGNSQTGSMYLLDPNSKNIRQLNFGQDNDWNPVVLNNGRIMYLRWEYTDAAHYFTRILMSMNPDGTGKKEYYGSGSYWPNSVFEARPIPGSTSRFCGIVSGHHGTVRSGRLIIFDPAQGRHEADGVIQEIPFKDKEVEPIIKDQLVDGIWPQFLSAYPLDDKFYLANVKPGPDALWGLYLVDVFDNMTLISESNEQALMYPMLLEKRQPPPVIPDKINLKDSTSTVYIANIYEGPGLKDVPKGSVDKLRLFAYHFTYNYAGGHDALGIQTGWDVKRILGTVPVEEDGSAIFKIPANTPISLQPLDVNGRAMQLMRSWFTGMPGEVVSCVGCHENQNSLPPVRPTIASRKLPDNIDPFYGEVRPFTFDNEIQPLLDRKCIVCHNEKNELPDFSNTDESGYRNLSGSYKALHPYVRRPGPESDVHILTPMDYHASTSELIQKLEKGHHNVILSREEWDRLHTWIDLNVPYHGQFESKEFSGFDQISRRQELAKGFGSTLVDIEKELELAIYLKGDQNTDPVMPEKVYQKNKTENNLKEWPFDKESAKAKQNSHGKIERIVKFGDGLQIKMVKIPEGTYVRNQDSKIVNIDKSYWIGQFEITNAQFKYFFPEHDSRYVAQFWKDHTSRGYPVNNPDQPAVRISWDECVLFCEKLSDETGLVFSLPSAEQWEWACRAGAGSPFWFGKLDSDFTEYENLADESLSDFAVIGVNPKPMSKDDIRFGYYNYLPQAPYNDGQMISATVGIYAPNPWGLYDMHGNVSEWVLSEYAIESRNESVIINDNKKQVKGGSWRDRPYSSTVSSVIGYYPWQRVENVGFRLVMNEE